MAIFSRQKEALRAAVYAFCLGAHRVTEEVDKMQSLIMSGLDEDKGESRDARRTMILENYERFFATSDAIQILTQTLNEEELYPFGSKWVQEPLEELFQRVIPLHVTFVASQDEIEGAGDLKNPEDMTLYRDADDNLFWAENEAEEEDNVRLRFRKGFKKILNDYASAVEGEKVQPDTIDHWMLLLINTAFHSGMNAAAQLSENSKAYYKCIAELELEEEIWSHYPQLTEIFERQLRRETRRKTGLVSDLDYE